MTDFKLLQEIEAWLSFNTSPTQKQIARLKEDLKAHISKRSQLEPLVMPLAGGQCDYFVSYYYETEKKKDGFWNTTIINQKPIVDQKGIAKLVEVICDGHLYTKVIILNFQLISQREA